MVYFWTAVAKMDPVWVAPDFLPSLFSPRFNAILESYLHPLLVSSSFPPLSNLAPGQIWQFAAVSTIAVELLLAMLLLLAPGPRINALLFPCGVLLHLSMEASGLQIGHFSYFMAIFYILLLPSSFETALQATLTLLNSTTNKLAVETSRLRPSLLADVVGAVLALTSWAGGQYLMWAFLPFDRAALLFHLLTINIVMLLSFIGARLPISISSRRIGPTGRQARAASSRRNCRSIAWTSSGLIFLLCCGTLVAFEARTHQYVQMNQTGAQDALKMGNLSLGTTLLLHQLPAF